MLGYSWPLAVARLYGSQACGSGAVSRPSDCAVAVFLSPGGCFGYFDVMVRYDAHLLLRYFGITLMENALGALTFCRMLEGNVTTFVVDCSFLLPLALQGVCGSGGSYSFFWSRCDLKKMVTGSRALAKRLDS